MAITIASLANDARRASAAIDNGEQRFIDALVQLKIKSGASVGGTPVVNVYAYGAIEPTEVGYSGDPSGSVSAYNGTFLNCHSLGVLTVIAAATAYTSKVFSIAALFGGRMPDKWGIIIENKTGNALDATAASHKCGYRGLWTEVG
jgi:hypothetical protein